MDVLAGVIETHGRSETAALLEGMRVLPRKKLEHRGFTLEEFDIDAVLAQRPQLVLVDELAHTNAPGSRHAKRYQDVLEIIDAGIDVYTTLNVQHIESQVDIVQQISGVAMQETVPDSILDVAHEIQLIDLSVEKLLERMADGKVYLGERAEQAMGGFFKEGNLTALRELALRFTAEQVDRDLEDIRMSQTRQQPVEDQRAAHGRRGAESVCGEPHSLDAPSCHALELPVARRVGGKLACAHPSSRTASRARWVSHANSVAKSSP
ncbi:MAG: hypothetical protein U1F81_11555 [Verrucomicrobiaceae bacterium]